MNDTAVRPIVTAALDQLGRIIREGIAREFGAEGSVASITTNRQNERYLAIAKRVLECAELRVPEKIVIGRMRHPAGEEFGPSWIEPLDGGPDVGFDELANAGDVIELIVLRPVWR